MEKTLATTKSPWTKQQVDLITSTVAKGATSDELKLFLYTASRSGLDPLTRQIHFVKRGGQMTIQTGIDGYRTIAERSGTLAGIDDAIYDNEEEAHPKKASVTVYRMISGERVAFTASARWSEYAPQGNQAFMWNKMPYLMLAKCAEALALRKAFPNDLTGLYTNEEMSQADAPVATPSRPVVDDSEPTYEPVENQPIEGKVVGGGGDDPKKLCPYCETWHGGKYPKCMDCWKREKNGEVLKEKATKTIVNDDAPPFESGK